MNQITIANVLNPAEAGPVYTQLETAGFHPFVPDANTALVMEGYSLAFGGIHIQVPEHETANAKEFLAHKDE